MAKAAATAYTHINVAIVIKDRSCQQRCRARHANFLTCTYSWNFWGKEMSGKVDIYTSENLRPTKNIGIATEIASISVSVAKLLVLPVLVTVSTSGLHRIVLCL